MLPNSMDRTTRTCENNTFPQLRWWAVQNPPEQRAICTAQAEGFAIGDSAVVVKNKNYLMDIAHRPLWKRHSSKSNLLSLRDSIQCSHHHVEPSKLHLGFPRQK